MTTLVIKICFYNLYVVELFGDRVTVSHFDSLLQVRLHKHDPWSHLVLLVPSYIAIVSLHHKQSVNVVDTLHMEHTRCTTFSTGNHNHIWDCMVVLRVESAHKGIAMFRPTDC